MTTTRIAAAFALACATFFAPALASAQPEPMRVETVHAEAVSSAHVSLHGAHAPRLADESDRLTPPDASEYALPVIGIVLGAGFVIAGVGSLLASALMAIGESIDDRNHDQSTLFAGLGAAGVAVGAVSIIVSAVALAGLRRRTREAQETPNLEGLALAPVEGGAVATAWGTF